MLIKMVIGEAFREPSFAGLVRLPTGLILEGQKSKLREGRRGRYLGSCGPGANTDIYLWLGFREHFDTLQFHSESVA